jgi:RNA polymerase sigma-B factor
MNETPSPGPEEQLLGERRLLERYAEDQSPVVREELVDRFMPLARRLAGRYAGGAEPFDDLVQVASVGLVKAINRFDPERGTAFSTFAVPTILEERILKVEKATAELPAKLGHAPTVQEIGQRIGASDEEVLEAMHASQGHHAISLDATSTMGDGDEPGPLRDRIGSEDLSFDTVEYGEAIGPVLKEISDRDRQVLHLRFVEDLTQSEIAERVGVSQMHVSRILRATIEKLRQRIPEEEL